MSSVVDCHTLGKPSCRDSSLRLPARRICSAHTEVPRFTQDDNNEAKDDKPYLSVRLLQMLYFLCRLTNGKLIPCMYVFYVNYIDT